MEHHRSVVEALTRHVAGRLSPARYEHSVSTADTASKLCKRFAIDSRKGYLAGLLHDIARELPDKRILELVGIHDDGKSGDKRIDPLLLHGRAGAVIAQKDFGINDPGILEAITDHVTGRPGMSVLSRIVFVSDMLEPLRGFLTESKRREVLKSNLNNMMLFVLEETFAYLSSKNIEIAEPAILLYDEVLTGKHYEASENIR